jgi:hypothetical protein
MWELTWSERLRRTSLRTTPGTQLSLQVRYNNRQVTAAWVDVPVDAYKVSCFVSCDSVVFLLVWKLIACSDTHVLHLLLPALPHR